MIVLVCRKICEVFEQSIDKRHFLKIPAQQKRNTETGVILVMLTSEKIKVLLRLYLVTILKGLRSWFK